MLKALNIMQQKHVLISRRQLVDRILQSDLVNDRHFEWALCSGNDLDRRFAFFSRLFKLNGPLAEMHQDLVYGHSMQPRRERRVAAETAYFSIKLNEDILCKILGLESVLQHAQTDRVNAAMMPLIYFLKGSHIAASGSLRELKIRGLRNGLCVLALDRFGGVGRVALLKNRKI